MFYLREIEPGLVSEGRESALLHDDTIPKLGRGPYEQLDFRSVVTY
jgi:hypothetical protein